jgi:rare lipoprotein A
VAGEGPVEEDLATCEPAVSLHCITQPVTRFDGVENMRTILGAALAVIAVGAADVRPASAWACAGPEYVCGPAPSATYSAPKKALRAPATVSYSAAAYAPAPKRKAVTFSGPAYGGSVTSGMASYYWQPQKVASGGWFNPNAMTAAHKTLPFGTKVRVTNRGNGRSVVVTINDRGPYVAGRIIDLSKAAAGAIGMQGQGVARVEVAVLGR